MTRASLTTLIPAPQGQSPGLGGFPVPASSQIPAQAGAARGKLSPHGHLAAQTPRAAAPSFLPHLTGDYRKTPAPAPAPSCKGKHRCQMQAGAASANIDRAGKATSARCCSLLRANGKEPPLGRQRCPGGSVPAQGGTHTRVRPGSGHPRAPLSTPPSPESGAGAETLGQQEGEDALGVKTKDQQHPESIGVSPSGNAWQLPGAELISGSEQPSPEAPSRPALTQPQDPPVPHVPSEPPKTGLGTPLVPRGNRDSPRVGSGSRWPRFALSRKSTPVQGAEVQPPWPCHPFGDRGW